MKNITRIGLIKFTNCLPVNFYLEKENPENTDFIYGTPAELNRLLADGKIDFAPVSAFEYLRDKKNYSNIGNACISSDGECGSVFLFSRKEIGDLKGCKIGLPGDSATSIAMLRIILEKKGISSENTEFKQHDYSGGIDGVLDSGFDAALFIGDNALIGNHTPHAPCNVYDLGRLWKDMSGYPAVFGMFSARNAWISENPVLFEKFNNMINKAIETSLELYFNEVINIASKNLGLEKEIMEDYLSAKISYAFTPSHKKSLELLESLI